MPGAFLPWEAAESTPADQSSTTVLEGRSNASPSANERLMKPLTRCVLGLSYHSVMKMEHMRLCNAGAPLATAGALRRMEPSGLGLE